MKKILFGLLSGILLALAWPTYGFPLLLFFGFVPLLYAEFQLRSKVGKHTAWKVFGLAYLSFFIWNIITTYWLYFSTPSGMIFAILANTLLMALVFVVYHHIAKRIPFVAASVFLTTLWICFEYLHLHWQFSWPWLNLGNGFSEYPRWIQWYEYTGNFGGTLWVWLVNLMVFKSLLLFIRYKEKAILYRGILKVFLVIGIPIAVSLIIWNTYPSEKNQESIEALILQPNINPYTEKYTTTDRRVGQLLEQMTNENISDSTKIVIAPETVFADGTEIDKFDNSTAHLYGEQILRDHPQTSFLSGISFFKKIQNKDSVQPQSNFYRPGGFWFNDYNSAFLLSNNHKDQIYHKSKLVVGVETFPYQNILKPVLGDIMIDLGGTVAKKTTQPNREAFTFDGKLKTAPIICYESVYGEYVNGYIKNGAQFLSIITNDAWWGDTQGHKQHVSYARLRAIETRRDIAQSANNGTSAIINQKGEILKKTDYGKRAVLKGEIHLNNTKTFYVEFGDYIARISEFLTLFIFLFAVFRKRKDSII